MLKFETRFYKNKDLNDMWWKFFTVNNLTVSTELENFINFPWSVGGPLIYVSAATRSRVGIILFLVYILFMKMRYLLTRYTQTPTAKKFMFLSVLLTSAEIAYSPAKVCLGYEPNSSVGDVVAPTALRVTRFLIRDRCVLADYSYSEYIAFI
jgi:hypothetical protein